MLALLFLVLFVLSCLLMVVFSGERMLKALAKKYRYGIYFVLAAAAYLFIVDMVDGWNSRSTTPAYGEQVVYACASGKIPVMYITNGKFKPLLFVNTDNGEGLSPNDFYKEHGKCIMFERRQPFTISAEGVTPYLPIINKAKEEGQYE